MTLLFFITSALRCHQFVKYFAPTSTEIHSHYPIFQNFTTFHANDLKEISLRFSTTCFQVIIHNLQRSQSHVIFDNIIKNKLSLAILPGTSTTESWEVSVKLCNKRISYIVNHTASADVWLTYQSCYTQLGKTSGE